jgi:hypothetical protein
MGWLAAATFLFLILLGPRPWIIGAGYLIQKFKFGNSFRETYEYHKEQDNRKGFK